MASLVLHRWGLCIRSSFKIQLLASCTTGDIPPTGTPKSIDNTIGEEEEFTGPIPRDRVNISYVRGSGPGGQNVNKLNTKALVRFNVAEADWLSDRIKDRLNRLYKTKINKAGEIIATSHKHRTQSQNLTDALLKLEGFIKIASEIPKGPSELSRERMRILKRKYEWKRLKEKKYNSERKINRRFDDE